MFVKKSVSILSKLYLEDKIKFPILLLQDLVLISNMCTKIEQVSNLDCKTRIAYLIRANLVKREFEAKLIL